MKWRIDYRPAYAVLKVELEPGEEVWSEPGALMLLRGDVEVRTQSGGITSGLLRKLAGSESFFLNRYRARSRAEVWFAPSLPGDIDTIEVNGEWVIQDASYLAHYGDLKVTASFRGLRGLIAEGELFWLKVEGHGIVWVNSYGGIERVEVGPGERLVIDNYHFVAMPADTRYTVRKFGGLKTFLFGGEGFVIEVTGPATVYVQTRILPPFARLLARFLPKS
ncbi:TIGR00266 family protein [Hyperthermus butylicus]|uniref:Universally conserved protein n=1 Tax=Hyperthermus butylicus (strain DSM 5456 / JCM 9403 / PLM1-5) TaxID=415426 RepID=A2BKD5_HYPBU|nr:TIGR00266 family protein [Hyperthermus butylicus]ABM80446.1 universally conserved protein [Hyperthermus butylicus DSM 5456]